MSDITTSYTYTDGLALDPDGHNSNIYDGSQPSPNGIMSTVNGGLSATNLDDKFAAHPEHIQTEQHAISDQEGMRQRVDTFAEAFAAGEGSGDYSVVKFVAGVTSPAPLSRWFPVPGCGIRFYQPFTASVVLWQWSFFFHPARLSMVNQEAGGGNENTVVDFKENCEIGLAAMVDGALVEHTRRQTKMFMVAREADVHKGFLTSGSAAGGRTAEWWDMCHLQKNVTRGWHDLQLMIYMERFSRDNALQQYTLIRNGVAADPESNIALGGRASFGIRNARVLTLL